MDGQVRIDCSLIPPIELKLLGKAFYEDMQKFYENPENVKGYEAWKAKRQEALV